MLTLEEQERHAYITNSPCHALIVRAIEGDEAVTDELRHERDMAQEESARLERENTQLQDAVEVAESKVLTLESELENTQDEVKELRGQIHAAAVDLL
jgi:predicted  nucleic acid-binding Zn-ribbon protein